MCMKTAISIPDDLFETAERLAGRMGISRSELYQRAVRKFVQDNRQEAITETLNRVYDDEPDISRLDSVLETIQVLSIPKEEW